MMAYLVSILATLTLLAGSLAVIATSLRGRGLAIVAALLGERQEQLLPPLQRHRPRATLRTKGRLSGSSPLLAAA